MITDKCRCGAIVTIKHKYYSEETRDHARWLDAHATCRANTFSQIDETKKRKTFLVSYHRICDYDPSKYGEGWGIYDWTIGNVKIRRHCFDGENVLESLARVLSDKRNIWKAIIILIFIFYKNY